MQGLMPLSLPSTWVRRNVAEGWGAVSTDMFWGAAIPYLPEYCPERSQTIGPEGLAAYQSWLRFVAAVAQLPHDQDKTVAFDLRFRYEPTADGSARIALAVLGRASQPGVKQEHQKVIVEDVGFAWRALNGLLPPQYPLQPVAEAELTAWLMPYGPRPYVAEIRKRVVLLEGHSLKRTPYRFFPNPAGPVQTCRAMLARGRPCTLSVAIAPTALTRAERQQYSTALEATLAGLASAEQAPGRLRIELIQEALQEGLGEKAAGGSRTAAARAALPDPQIAAAVAIYSQFLAAAALLSVRITVASPEDDPAYEIAQAFGAELTGVEDNHDLTLSGYELVEANPEKLVRRFHSAGTVTDEKDRLAVLCTPYEAAAAFRLPLVVEPWIGIPSRPQNPFRPASAFWDTDGFAASAAQPARPTICLGPIVDDTSRHRGLPDYHVRLDDLTQHVLIVGGTGSGKTTTGLHLVQEVRQAASVGEPVRVLLIDPVKTELRPLARYGPQGRSMLTFSVGSQFSPFHLDAFRVPDGVSPEQHLQIITGCFSAAFPMSGPLELLLTRSMRDVYRDLYGDARLGAPLKPADTRPETPPDILSYIALKARERIKSYAGEVKGNLTAAVQHRLEWLAESTVGRAIVPQSGDRILDVDTLLANDVLIELRLLPGNEEKALVMALLIALMGEHYSYAIAARGGIADTGGRLRHLTWMDEAQRLFSAVRLGGQEPDVANARGKAIELFVEMLSEMRSRGEGLIISTQLPSLLDLRVRKHPGMKIMHRLTPEDDRNVLGATMDLDEGQLRFVTRLPAGEAVVFRGQLPAAVLVRVPDIRRGWAELTAQGRAPTHEDWLRATTVSDEEIAAAMQGALFGRVQKESQIKFETLSSQDDRREGGSIPMQGENATAAAQTPPSERVSALTSCPACNGRCQFADRCDLLWPKRNRGAVQEIWQTLREENWPALTSAVGKLLQEACEPGLVYCVLARMARAAGYDGRPIADKHTWIRDRLAAFAEHAQLTWVTQETRPSS
jgi:hypothetical protein